MTKAQADLVFTRDSELMVVLVQAQTERGTEFIDSAMFTPMVVVDSGRIILSEEGAKLLAAHARDAKLTEEHEQNR